MSLHNRRTITVTFSRLGIAACAMAALILSSRSFAGAGDLYVTDLATGSVVVYAPDGTPTTFASGLTSPQGIAFDQAKNLYVVDAGDGGPTSGTIFKYDLATATQTTFRSGLNNPGGMTLDGSDLLVCETGAGRVIRVPQDGVHPPTIFQVIAGPIDVDSNAFTQSGTGFFRYITNGASVIEVDPDQTTTDIDPGDGSRGVSVDDRGNVFVTTEAGTVTEIPVDGTPLTFSSGFTQPTGMDFRPGKFSGDTDRVGFLYVADTATGEISQIAQLGTKTTFVTGAGMPNYMVFETNQPTPPPTPTPTPSPSPSASPTPTPPGKALNISTRVDVETGDNVGIGGFIITGTDPKLVVIRAIGPSLVTAGIPGPLGDPFLELHDSTGAIIAGGTNNDWMDNSAEDQAVLVGHNLAPSDDLESALVVTLDPGTYTAIVRGNSGETGVALVEVYDLDDPGVSGELGNISTRGLVGTDTNVLIGGIIIGPVGGIDASVVVRAIGPSLANIDPPVVDALVDPVLELHNGDGDLIAKNDNWQTDAPPDDFSAEVEAAGLAPNDDAESAIFANLIGGLYTAIVTGKDGTTGVALVEVYHVASQVEQPNR